YQIAIGSRHRLALGSARKIQPLGEDLLHTRSDLLVLADSADQLVKDAHPGRLPQALREAPEVNPIVGAGLGQNLSCPLLDQCAVLPGRALALQRKSTPGADVDHDASILESGDMIELKRAYEPPSRRDGYRVLVERLWPRGVKKEALALDAWEKDLAP